jgi:hypothetical protein
VLQTLLRIPDRIQLDNRSVFSGLDALCILLKRLSYPCRLYDLSRYFGRHIIDLSLIIQFIIKYIIENFDHLLSNLDQPWLNIQAIEQYARAIQNKGSPLDRCWGFIDGSIVQICRPIENQRHLYSGHKKVHCIKFQAITVPNGLIASLIADTFWGRDMMLAYMSNLELLNSSEKK